MTLAPQLRAVAALLTVSALAAGCATYETVSPVEPLSPPLDALDAKVRIMPDQADSLFCVIDNGVGGTPFFPALYKGLTRRGFDVKLLPPGSSIAACPITATYVATPQSYWRTFLSYADITVYRYGERAGRAVYDARRSQGGLNLSNWVEPDMKIEQLVDQLFPGRRPPPEAAQAPGQAPAAPPDTVAAPA